MPHSLEHISLQHPLGITVLSVRNWAQRHTQVHVGTLCQSWILSQAFWILCLYPPLKHLFPYLRSPFLRKVSLWQTEWDWVLSVHEPVSLHYSQWSHITLSHVRILPQILKVMQNTKLDWHSISFTLLSVLSEEPLVLSFLSFLAFLLQDHYAS